MSSVNRHLLSLASTNFRSTVSKLSTDLRLPLICFSALTLAACDNPPRLPDGARIKNADGIEFVVTGNNSNEVAKLQELLPTAKEYATKVQSNAETIQAMKHSPQGQELTNFSKQITNLKNEGEIFGTFAGQNSTLLHRCRAAGFAVDTYWRVKAGVITTTTSNEALESYNEVMQDCNNQINKPAEATVTITGRSEQVTPPFKGCMGILILGEKTVFSDWTCPASVIPS